ncbi:MAG: hypothetical protein ACSHYF_11975 [Verrucomicrobiaceae bacterium]
MGGFSFDRVFVVVHGIGKQQRGATLRGAVRQVGKLFVEDEAGGWEVPDRPLGYYFQEWEDAKARHGDGESVPCLPMGPSGPLARVGMSEVFWADIPQGVVDEGRTIEETKSWGETVIQRLLCRYFRENGGKEEKGKEVDFTLASEVLDEVIDSVHILEKLAQHAKFLNLPKVETQAILDEFLGDVQIVTEFRNYRTQIVDRFLRAVDQAHRDHPGAEIHIVSHSEGTVVSFLGLLLGLAGREPEQLASQCEIDEEGLEASLVRAQEKESEWVGQVRTFLTLGSPLDKHLTLWPDLFAQLDFEEFSWGGAPRIRWMNCYDYGDPIGFRLNQMQDWLEGTFGAENPFERIEEHGFSRYLFPGVAHVNYWGDEELFQYYVNFLERDPAAVGSEGEVPRLGPAKKEGRLPNKKMVKVLSPILPFTLSFVLFGLAVGAIYFGIASIFGSIDGDLVLGSYEHIHKVSGRFWGSFLLIVGATVSFRIPRICRGRGWLVFSAACFGVGAWAYWYLVDLDFRALFGGAFGDHHTLGVILCALLVSVIGMSSSKRMKLSEQRRRGVDTRKHRKLLNGMKPALGAGLVVILGLAVFMTTSEKVEATLELATVVRFLTGAVFFFYLWWLAALFFDLSLVWNRYVRQDITADLRTWGGSLREKIGRLK